MKKPEVSIKSAFKKKRKTRPYQVQFSNLVYSEDRETLIKLYFRPTQAANSNVKLLRRELKAFLKEYPDCPELLAEPLPSPLYLKAGKIRVDKSHIPNESSFLLTSLPDMEDPEDWSDEELLSFDYQEEEEENDYKPFVYKPYVRLEPPAQEGWFSKFIKAILFGMIAYAILLLMIQRKFERAIKALIQYAGNVVCEVASALNPFNWVSNFLRI